MTSLSSCDGVALLGVVTATAVIASSATIVCGAWLRRRRHGSPSKTAHGPINTQTPSAQLYDTESAARQYMEFHYTPSHESYVHHLRAISESFDFPRRIAEKFGRHLPQNRETLRGLDIGCATGASVFEMSKYFGGEVIGIDYSEVFIHLAMEVAKSGQTGVPVSYTTPLQGDLVQARTTTAPPDTHPHRCHFFAGDAMDLFEEDHPRPPTPSTAYPDVRYWQAGKGERFDGILCLNLIDRVPEPRRLLKSFGRLLSPGGVLILADPYSWWEGACAKERWLGGTGTMRSEEVIKELLSDEFVLASESNEPFLMRNHARHYQLGFSHCMVWKKR